MPDGLDHTNLKAKQRALRAGFPETMGLRVHRSISWIGRAEAAQDDPDAQFLFLWIGLNAAYADEEEFQAIQPGERASFAGFFDKVVMLDAAAILAVAAGVRRPAKPKPSWRYHGMAG